MRRVPGRRAFAAAAALSLGSLALVVLQPTAASAQSATVSVPYRCVTTMFATDFDALQTISVRITTPADADAGTTFPVTYDLPASPPKSVPTTITNAVLRATPSVTGQKHTGGAVTTVSAVGTPGAPATIPAYGNFAAPMPVSIPMSTTGYAPGDRIDIRPGKLVIDVLSGDDGIGGSSMTCNPEPSAPVATYVGVANAIPASPVDNCVAQAGNTTGPPGCDTQQDINATITGGTLSQQATATSPNPNSTTVNFPSVVSSTTTQSVTRPLNTVTVTDTRGGRFGWSLTASLSGYTGASASAMAAATTKISGISCVGDANSAASTASAGGSFGSTQSLCQVAGGAEGPNQSSGGKFAVDGTLQLDVPAFQRADVYSAVLTITLS